MKITPEEARAWADSNPEGTPRDCAAAFGVAHSTAQIALHAAGVRPGTRGRPRRAFGLPPSTTIEIRGDKARIETDRVLDVEDLLEHAGVNRAEWEVERTLLKKWEVGTKDAQGNPVVTPLFGVTAWLKRPAERALAANLRAEILAELKSEAPVPRPLRVPALQDTDVLLELSVPDLHIGKYAWAEETGQDYDANLAIAGFREAVNDLLDQVAHYPVARILLPVGNDLLHIDGIHHMTTGGTPQDTDTRYLRVFRLARRLLTETIERLRAIAPVDVLIVPGNHDQVSCFLLGDALECRFHNYEDVQIDNRASLRKYYEWGLTLLGFTHGNEEKQDALPSLMAGEQRDAWGRTRFAEWHTGHQHRRKEVRFISTNEDRGAVIRQLPSLSATDAWHAKRGYTGQQLGAQAHIYMRDRGHRAFFEHLKL